MLKKCVVDLRLKEYKTDKDTIPDNKGLQVLEP